jgi:parallel beta-helix repeat protein
MKRTAYAPTLIMALIFSFLLCGILVPHVASQSFETIYIRADGSVGGTDKIQRNGNVYTLTGNISGGIQVQKSYIVIDGAGYAVEGNGEETGIDLSNGRGQAPSRAQINNVTVKNLQIINCYYAIGNVNTNNNTFIGNYILDCDTGFWIIGSHNNTLIGNTVKDCITGISINYGSSGNVITENNIINSSVSIWLSPAPMVDKNYWSDYLTRYPNAKEIGSSGIWDTPYDRETFTDNHPLVEPVPVIPEFPSLIPVLPLVVAVVSTGLLVYNKKRTNRVK